MLCMYVWMALWHLYCYLFLFIVNGWFQKLFYYPWHSWSKYFCTENYEIFITLLINCIWCGCVIRFLVDWTCVHCTKKVFHLHWLRVDNVRSPKNASSISNSCVYTAASVSQIGIKKWTTMAAIFSQSHAIPLLIIQNKYIFPWLWQ